MHRLIFLLMFSFLFGCGGGGSGNSTSREGLRILHGAIDFPPLEILSSVSEQSLGFEQFLGSGQRMRLMAEDQELRVFARGRFDDRFSTLSLSNFTGGNASYLVYGDYNNYGLRIARLSEALPEFDSRSSVLRVAHAVLGAAKLRIELISGQTILADFGSASNFVVIEPGDYSLVIRRDADGREVSRVSLQLPGGKSSTLLVAGEVDVFIQSRVYFD